MGSRALIKHIEFWVSDLKRSMIFYNNLFNVIGWDCTEENSFSNGQTKIYLIEQSLKSQKTIGPRHICFLVGSRKIVNKVAAFLIRSKADVIRGPLESRYKDKSSYTVDFRDPDGYVIEVATKSVPV